MTDNEEINLLELHPVRKARFEPGEEGIVVYIPKWKSQLSRRIMGILTDSMEYRVHLDEYGSFVFNLCTGDFTVKEIGERLRKRFGEDAEPLYQRLSVFLTTLEDSGMITYREFLEDGGSAGKA